jgi:hypothetical protein
MSEPPGAQRTYDSSPSPVGIAFAVLAVAAIAFLAWFFLIRDDDSDEPRRGAATTEAAAEPFEASEDELRELAADSSFPIYWAGGGDGNTIEVTETTDGRVYVRYLDDADIGDPRPNFLTVGSYEVKDAYDVLQEFSESDDAISSEVPDGGIAVLSQDVPTSVYVAFPDEDVQIEVYDPDPDEAFAVATSGDVEPVE